MSMLVLSMIAQIVCVIEEKCSGALLSYQMYPFYLLNTKQEKNT